MKWVFWIQISRRTWFKRFWATRGANFREIQLFNLCVNIGAPWHKSTVDSYTRTYPTTYKRLLQKTNEGCLGHKFSILLPQWW